MTIHSKYINFTMEFMYTYVCVFVNSQYPLLPPYDPPTYIPLPPHPSALLSPLLSLLPALLNNLSTPPEINKKPSNSGGMDLTNERRVKNPYNALVTSCQGQVESCGDEVEVIRSV